MVRELSHYIGGQHVEGTSGRFSDVYDPCTGEVQARLPLASAEKSATWWPTRRRASWSGPP